MIYSILRPFHLGMDGRNAQEDWNQNCNTVRRYVFQTVLKHRTLMTFVNIYNRKIEFITYCMLSMCNNSKV